MGRAGLQRIDSHHRRFRSIHENLVLGVVLIDMIHGFLIVPVLPRRSCARASPCSKAVKRREGTYQGSISERGFWGSNMARRRHSGAYFTEDSGDSGSEDYAIRYDLKLPLAPFMSYAATFPIQSIPLTAITQYSS